MKKNRRLIGMIVSTVALLVVGVIVTNGAHAASNTSLSNASSLVTDHDLKHLLVLGTTFDDSSMSNGEMLKLSKINVDIAIANAKSTFPGWAHDATEIKSEYHVMTNTHFRGFSLEALNKNSNLKTKGYMDKMPVYIVAFKGMSYSGNVPANYHGKVPVHHEYDVVVDATTGEVLMGFSYR